MFDSYIFLNSLILSFKLFSIFLLLLISITYGILFLVGFNPLVTSTCPGVLDFKEDPPAEDPSFQE